VNALKRLEIAWSEWSKKRRIDSNFGNLFMLVGLMAPALSIVMNGPVPSSSLADMSDLLQILMCTFMFIGCGTKLFGALAGRRWFFNRMPLWTCYRLGVTGAFFASPAGWVYGYYLFNNTPNAWSAVAAVSTPCFATGIALQAVLYWLEARRLERNMAIGVAKARTQ
jgi:hypothetical protein